MQISIIEKFTTELQLVDDYKNLDKSFKKRTVQKAGEILTDFEVAEEEFVPKVRARIETKSENTESVRAVTVFSIDYVFRNKAKVI